MLAIAVRADSQPVDGGTWKLLAPSLRTGASTIYDPIRNRMILFGGNDNLGFRNDVWELPLSGPPVWNELHPFGPLPPPVQGHTAIYDPIRDRMVVYGGYRDTTDCPSCETYSLLTDGVWELSLSGTPQWTHRSPRGVTSSTTWHIAHTAIYDPFHDRMLVYGGAPAPDELWALSLADSMQWIQINPSGSTPSGRAYHSAILDPVRGRMLVFGCDNVCGSPGDVWSLNLLGQPTWTKIVPGGTSVTGTLSGGCAVYDPLHDVVVLRPQPGSVSEVWELSLNGLPRWSSAIPGGIQPSLGGSGIYDSRGRRMIIYGADLSALSLAGTLEWQDFYPLRRDAPSVIYDPVGCRMVMFGGYKDGRNLDDVWTLSMGPQAIWTKLNVATGPAARYLHTAVYDPTGDRMLVFGGFSGVAVDTDFTDVWALGLRANVAWHQILPSRAGPSRGRNRVAVYLQRPDELAILGGSADVGLLDDNWVLQLGDHPAWERISVSGSRPPAGPLCAFYEPARNRIIVGLSDGVYSLWMDNPHWTTVVSQSADWAHSVYDSMRNRLLTYHVPTWHLSLRDSTFGELAMSGPSLSPLSYGSIVDAPNDRAVFYGSQDNSLRTLSWVAAGQETLFARAEVLNGGVPLADSSAFTSLPNFVARIPGVSCLDVALCLVRVDGTDISPPSTAEPQDAIELALPTLSEGEHRLDLRLVSFGVRRVVATATLAFSIIVPQDRLWIGDLHATPNPGHGRIRLGFRLTRPADYTIDFFDLSGRRVARSAGAHGVAGLNSYQWDGTVDGRRAGSGCYLYKVTATDGSAIVTANGRALFLR